MIGQSKEEEDALMLYVFSFFLLLLILLSYHDEGRAVAAAAAAASLTASFHKLFKVEHNFLAVQRTKMPPKGSKKAKPTVSGQKALSSFFVLASASSNGGGSSGGGGVISASQVTPTHFRDATMRALGKGKGEAAESGLDEAKKSEDITKAGVDSSSFETCGGPPSSSEQPTDKSRWYSPQEHWTDKEKLLFFLLLPYSFFFFFFFFAFLKSLLNFWLALLNFQKMAIFTSAFALVNFEEYSQALSWRLSKEQESRHMERH